MMTRECKQCGETKALAEFPARRRWYLYTCQACFDAARREKRNGLRKCDAENHLGLRLCRSCTTILPLEDFPFSHKTKAWRRRECVECCKARVGGWLVNNRARHISNCARYYQRLRDRVFKAYGNACVCCGESTPEFLVIDHVNRDGAKHRKEVLGAALFKWIIANDFPPSLRILCANCNTGREKNGGVCPHETGSTTRAQARTAEAIAAGSASHPYPAYAGLMGEEIVWSQWKH
jgi:hypothetical protein